ncbi:MAG: hypothetical protein IPJ84_03275 [Bdellovibrionales bacterium]|nr:hypothetical protein [Bdellovibrionales bacterium]
MKKYFFKYSFFIGFVCLVVGFLYVYRKDLQVTDFGKTYLYQREATEILIFECENSITANYKNDCISKSGAMSARVPLEQFKDTLEDSLRIPSDYQSLVKKNDRPESYRSSNLKYSSRLSERIRREYDIISDQIQTLPTSKATEDLKNFLRTAPADRKAIDQINTMASGVISEFLGHGELKRFVSYKASRFELNAVLAFVDKPELPSEFVKIKNARFLMGSPKDETKRFEN